MKTEHPSPLTRIYDALLHLYPREFRDEFGEEMQMVFADAVREAAQHGPLALARLCLREFVDLSMSSAREKRYENSRRRQMNEDTRLLDSAQDRLSWRETVLGLYPFAIGPFFLILSYPTPAPAWKLSLWYQMLTAAAILVPVVVLLGVGIARSFPRWSYPYIGVALTTVAVMFVAPLRNFLLTAEMQIAAYGLTLLALYAALVMAGRFWHPLAALYRGVRRDWTTLSFGLYIAAAFTAAMVDHDDYPVITVAVIAPSLIIFLGALAFLRSRLKLQSALALLIACALAPAVRVFEGMAFYPQMMAIMAVFVFLPSLLEFVPRSRTPESIS